MVFSIIIILLALGVTYMNFLQGAFTAAISLGCAFIATLVAFGYYESVVNMISPGKFTDSAGGLVLILLFTVTYLGLRIIFDAAIPGNIALPLYAEKAYAAIFGFLAAVLATGVFAVGVQLLPLGPSIGGYARYELRDRTVIIPAGATSGRNAIDSGVQDEMVADSMDPNAAASMLLPVDGMVLSLVGASSDGGYAGSQSFSDIHPDLRTEAFAARLGVEHSGNRVILNNAKTKGVTVAGVYPLPSGVVGLDSEMTDLRPSKTPLTFKLKPGDGLVVLRLQFDDSAVDKDGFVRITPAALRLQVNGTDYYPIGTMDTATQISLNRIDDQIPVPVQGKSRGADFVFELPKTALDQFTKGKAVPGTDAFVQAKLYGRVDLSGVPIAAYPGPEETVSVLHKPMSPLGLVDKATTK